jgi:hypothetical protein
MSRTARVRVAGLRHPPLILRAAEVSHDAPPLPRTPLALPLYSPGAPRGSARPLCGGCFAAPCCLLPLAARAPTPPHSTPFTLLLLRPPLPARLLRCPSAARRCRPCPPRKTSTSSCGSTAELTGLKPRPRVSTRACRP